VYHVRRLITYGDDVAQVEVDGIAQTTLLDQARSNWTALHIAAQCGNADAAAILLGQVRHNHPFPTHLHIHV
jgi:hypothetical protein